MMDANDDLIGQCFRAETCWGDDSPPWYIYRRVRRVMAGVAECHRFEVRPPQTALVSGQMHVFYGADVLGVKLLLKQECIEETIWHHGWDLFLRDVGEPWNVE